MADYYTYCSFTIPLTAEQQDWATNELYRMNDDDDDDRYPHVICEGSGSAPATGHDIVLTSDGVRSAKMEGEYLWIHQEESADIDALCTRLQRIMKHFDIPGTWGFQWSNDCSKPRTDAYGGGACTISQTEIESMTTDEWLAERLRSGE